MRPEGSSHRSGTRRSQRYGDLPRGIPTGRGKFASLRSKVGRIGRAGAGLLLVLGLASTLEPIVQAVMSSAAGAQPNLILNGSFEQPRQTSDAALFPGSGGLTDWTIGGGSVNLDDSGYWQAEDGLQSLDLSGNAPGSVSQTVTGTTAGATYNLSWFLAGNPECGQAVKMMDVYWNGILVDEPSFDTTGLTHVSMGWVEEQVNVVATGSDTVEFADAPSDQSSCGANLDNVSLVPASMADCASPSSFNDNFATDTSLSDCWETGTPSLSAAAVNEATSIAPELSFSGGMDMQGAAADPEFTGIESAAAYQAPFDFTTTVKAVQSGDNSFVIYIANTTGGGVSLEGDLSSSSFNGIWAAEATGYLGAGSDINSSVAGQAILSNQPLGTTFHISISLDDSGDIGINVNGTTITSAALGRIGNGPFRVILGQRESDDEEPGNPPSATPKGPNEAVWYNASLTTSSCSASSFSTDFGLDYANGSVYQGFLQDCWQVEQPPYTTLPPTIADVESAIGATDVSPNLTFEVASDLFTPMHMAGTTGNSQFTGIQSTYAYSAPFQLTTSVRGTQSNGSAFAAYLVNANATKGLSLEGDLNPADGGNYGIWANNGIGASSADTAVLSPNTPAVNLTYNITLSVDGSGNGTVTVTSSGGSGSVALGNVGTGPFYVVLGQHEGTPAVAGANGANWYSASLSPDVVSVSTTLSAGSPTVAGVETVPESVIPPTSVSGAAGSGSGSAASAPLSSIPLSSIALASSPLHSIPLSSIPLSSVALPGSGDTAITAAEQALSSALLSDIGITYDPDGCTTDACSGWNGILAGSKYALVPLESVTLEDVLQDTATGSEGQPSPAASFDSVDLSALDLSSSPLSSIPLSSIELGSLPLSSIGLAGTVPGSGALAQWCTTLASLNFPCSDFGISGSNDNGVTLLSLALAGVPLSSIPLSSIPLSSINLADIPLSSIPLSSIPLSSINLASSPLSSIFWVPLSSIPLSSIPLSSIPLVADIVNCNTYSQCSTATLGQAAQAGALLPSATLLDLPTYDGTTIGELPPSVLTGMSLAQLLVGDVTTQAGYPNITLGDLLVATMPPSSYPWQSVSLPALPLAADGTAGGTVTYTMTLTLSNGPANVAVDLALPPSFSYLPGSGTMTGEPSLADPTPCGSSLCWDFALEPASYTVTFQAKAGIGLGPAAATVSTSLNGAISSSTSATVNVVNGEQPLVDSPGSSLSLTPGSPTTTPGNLNIGYLTSHGDIDDWAVTVSAGEELSLALTNLPATYDLELFGPNAQQSQLQGTPSQDLTGVADTLPSITPGATTESTPGSEDLPVTPPAGDQLEAVSNNPDGQSQYIQTPPLAAGTYIVQVSGYNGAFSAQPYLLQANVLGGETAPSCPGGISYPDPLPDASQGAPPLSDLNVAIPSNVNTLFLVNTQRMSAAFGSAFDDPADPSQETVVTDLNSIAAASDAGVYGAVVPVDSYSGVQQAYALWNTNPCSVDAANGVVAAIGAVVDQLRAQYPTIRNIVIVGADDQIPLARIADGATQSNERDYGAATFAGENNVEGDALSLGYYFSDDPYAASQPLGVGSATLYTPQLAVGRLIESAPEIESALSRFVSSDGNLDATASLTTGYSFLASGAQAVEANLAANHLNSMNACDLIGESWAESDLDAALAGAGNCTTPGVDSLNAHFDYSRALPANDNTTGATSNLFTTTDVRNPPDATSYTGRLLFSMGCHAGLDIDDAEVDASLGATSPVDDWAKTFADSGALWVANTGYGYADTDTVAYSAKLMAEFASNLNGTVTIGEALAEAKQQYAADSAILSPYDLKALMESTFYGLPMYSLNGKPTGQTQPVPGPSTTTDSLTGETVAPVSLSLGQGTSTAAGQLGLVTKADGSYYQVNGTSSDNGGIQTTEYRPIEPLVTVAATEPNLVPHGALVTGLTSQDIPNFQPVYVMPAAGSADAASPVIGDAAFPGTLQRVGTYGIFTGSGTGAQLDLVAGQFLPNPSSSTGSGTERLFTSMSADVYYQASNAPLAGDYTPATVDSSQAVNTGSGLNFTVDVTPSSSDDPVERVLVLYTDAASPNGTWTDLNLNSGDGLGWAGTGAITSSGVAQYMVETVDAAGNVSVSNNEGSDFNSQIQTTTTLSSSVNPGLVGQQITFTATVGANVSGTGNPAGNVEFLDNGDPITVCGGVSGKNLSNAAVSCIVSYPSAGLHQITATYAGSTDFITSTTSAPLDETVNQPSESSPSTSLVASSTSPVVGQTVTYTATVTGPSGGATPTGTVYLEDGTNTFTCTGGNQTLSGSVNSATATCQVAYSSTSNSPHAITAFYDPGTDPNYSAGGGSNPVTVTVGPAGTSTTVVSTTGSPSFVGQPVTYTATVGVTSPGFGTPTGSVEFLDGGGAISGCTANPLSSSLPDTATCTVTSYGAAGTHSITAQYLGSFDFAASVVSASITQQVTARPSTATLSLTKSSVTYGAEAGETFTATVTGTSGSLPTGTVSIKSGSTTLCSRTNLTEKSASSVTAVCSLTNVEQAAGSYSVTAVYSGDTLNAGATSSPQSLTVSQDSTQTFLQGLPTTTPYGSEQRLVFGIVVLTGNGEALPASESLTINVGTASCVASMTPSLLGAYGSCSIAATALPVGSYKVSATYAGDTDLKSSSGTAAVGLTVTGAATTTGLSLSPSSVTYGNETTEVFLSTVTSLAGMPSGTVTVGSSGGTLCQITLVSGSGSCRLSAAQLAVGTISSVVATYYASGNFAGSTSSAKFSFAVSKDTTTTKVSESPTTVKSGAESASVFTATVTTGYGETVPHGDTVKVTVGSTSCTATLSSGTGTCKIGNSALAVGSYAVSAAYAGDASLGSSSGASSTNLTVSRT